MMVSFQRNYEERGCDKFFLTTYNCLLQKYTVHSMSAPHQQRTHEIKENYVRVIHGPT